MTETFNFKQWRAWLRAKAAESQNDNTAAEFRQGPDEGNKPGMSLGLVGSNALGLFENWVTGETDYTIHAPPGGPMVSHKWGLIVTDETFEAIFNEFVAEFHTSNSDLGSGMTAEGEVDQAFELAGRGWALVLKEGFRGTIPKNGLVQGDLRTIRYIGPEFVELISNRKVAVAVVIDGTAKEKFASGQSVRFYKS